jgi:hypothetical protein
MDDLGFQISKKKNPRHFASDGYGMNGRGAHIPWVGPRNPCNVMNYMRYLLATKVTIGNRKKVLYLEVSWLNGFRPKDIAQLIFDLTKKTKCAVNSRK